MPLCLLNGWDIFTLFMLQDKKFDPDAKPLPARGAVEVIVGGPPCQGFTLLNKFSIAEEYKFKASSPGSLVECMYQMGFLLYSFKFCDPVAVFVVAEFLGGNCLELLRILTPEVFPA